MKLDYEKLDVYHVAIEFVIASNNIIIEPELFFSARELLIRIISMLTKMVKLMQEK